MSEDEAERRARERIGAVLNEKWTLEALIGSGGMGAVYSARHRNGARAAVKVLHPELARHDEVRERFLREGYAANKVEHEGAVKVLDDDVITSGPDEGGAYLVMELLSGESLDDRLARGARPGERELLTIAGGVLAVLEAAHARGVVHRDIKPENLFLLESGGVKLLDFGLARLVEAESMTIHGVALGTPSFMSPEQAAGRSDEIDGRTDLFSLAATCFRVLAGRPVHEGVGPVDRVMKMANVPAPKVRDVAPQVSADVAAIIDRALEFRREDRYPSATVMRADVLAAVKSLDLATEKALAEERSKALVAVPQALPVVPQVLPIVQQARPPAKPKRSFIPMLTAVIIGSIAGKVIYDIVEARPSSTSAGAASTQRSAAPALEHGPAPSPGVVSAAEGEGSAGEEEEATGGDAADLAPGASDADVDDGDDDTDAVPDGGATGDAGIDAAPRPAVKPAKPRPRPHPPRPPKKWHH